MNAKLRAQVSRNEREQIGIVDRRLRRKRMGATNNVIREGTAIDDRDGHVVHRRVRPVAV